MDYDPETRAAAERRLDEVMSRLTPEQIADVDKMLDCSQWSPDTIAALKRLEDRLRTPR
jgi:hypothetical protein